MGIVPDIAYIPIKDLSLSSKDRAVHLAAHLWTSAYGNFWADTRCGKTLGIAWGFSKSKASCTDCLNTRPEGGSE